MATTEKVSQKQMDWAYERLRSWEVDFQKLMTGGMKAEDIDWNKRALAAGSVRATFARLVEEIEQHRPMAERS